MTLIARAQASGVDADQALRDRLRDLEDEIRKLSAELTDRCGLTPLITAASLVVEAVVWPTRRQRPVR
ncbi:nucleoside triphosphate pyrophosphohydrolase MazG [Cutibacterium acnes JCM 18918]|nr:nucleoside triphosphate pyrophosphohydrolase MazG [Cutibacterium acnes JCM 18918]